MAQRFRNIAHSIKRQSYLSVEIQNRFITEVCFLSGLEFSFKAYERSQCPAFDTFLDPTDKKYIFIKILIIQYVYG